MANIPKIKNVRVRQLDNNGNVSYKIVVVVKNDDNDEVANVAAVLSPATPESPAPSPSNVVCVFKKEVSDKNKKRYVNKDLTFASDSLDFEYNVTATMKNASGGTVGTPVTRTVAVEDKDDDELPTVSNIRITKTGGGEYNVYVDVINNEAGSVTSVAVVVIPSENDPGQDAPSPVRSSLTCAMQTNALFANLGGLLFGGEDALGDVYTVSATIDGGGSLQKDVTVVSE